MTRMTRPDCAVMCNLINTHTHTHPIKYHEEFLSLQPIIFPPIISLIEGGFPEGLDAFIFFFKQLGGENWGEIVVGGNGNPSRLMIIIDRKLDKVRITIKIKRGNQENDF